MILILIILKNTSARNRGKVMGEKEVVKQNGRNLSADQSTNKVIGLVQIVRGQMLYTALCVQAPVLKIPYKNPFH